MKQSSNKNDIRIELLYKKYVLKIVNCTLFKYFGIWFDCKLKYKTTVMN